MKYLSKSEVKKLMAVVDDDDWKLIFSLMLYEGLRVGEVVGAKYDYWTKSGRTVAKSRVPPEILEKGGNEEYKHIISETPPLTLENIDVENKILQVKGKGGKTRYVPLSNDVLYQLLKFIQRYEIRGGRLFQTTPQTVGKRLSAYAMEAGIRHVHPHQLRHTFSVNYIKNGGNIRALQKILGHSSLATTEKYLDMVLEDVQMDFEKVVGATMEQTRSKEEVAEKVARAVIEELW